MLGVPVKITVIDAWQTAVAGRLTSRQLAIIAAAIAMYIGHEQSGDVNISSNWAAAGKATLDPMPANQGAWREAERPR